MRLKAYVVAATTALGVNVSANAAIYQAEPAPALPAMVACDSLSVACDKEQGFILGAQYVGLVDTTGDFWGKNNALFSSLYLEAGWQFEQGLDVMVNWLGQFSQTTDRSLLSMENKTPLTDEHHIVNVEVGKTVHVGPRTLLRFHLGGQYLHVDRKAQHTFVDIAPDFPSIPGDPLRVVDVQQKFNGFGPRGGFQGEYWFNDMFALEGAMAVSVLVGNASVDAYVRNTFGDVIDGVSNNTRIVTAGVDGYLGGKLDVSKVHPSMQNVPLEVVGGYRWYTYPSAMNNYTAGGQGHFGAHGFYVGARTKLHRDLFAL